MATLSLAFAFVLLGALPSARAQSYPSRPILPAGSATDVVARVVGERM